jgi:hypothetical protein
MLAGNWYKKLEHVANALKYNIKHKCYVIPFHVPFFFNVPKNLRKKTFSS